MRFGTLGGEGSNHSLVLRRYLKFRGIAKAEIELFNSFEDGFAKLAEGKLDFLMQVSVHRSHTDMVARYLNKAHMVDVFVAPSKVLGVVSRRAVEKPRTIALQPATRCYVDLSKWEKHIDSFSISEVTEGLLAGRYDSGLTALEIVDQHPDLFRVDEHIGAVNDTWVLFSRLPVDVGEMLAWPEAPVTNLFRELSTRA